MVVASALAVVTGCAAMEVAPLDPGWSGAMIAVMEPMNGTGSPQNPRRFEDFESLGDLTRPEPRMMRATALLRRVLTREAARRGFPPVDGDRADRLLLPAPGATGPPAPFAERARRARDELGARLILCGVVYEWSARDDHVEPVEIVIAGDFSLVRSDTGQEAAFVRGLYWTFQAAQGDVPADPLEVVKPGAGEWYAERFAAVVCDALGMR
ncbi:MAG: hypothetical protein HY719_10820 [Planctomycetes bacterium]|nr:hypothetical protein [Planctomycetota bacterium]